MASEQTTTTIGEQQTSGLKGALLRLLQRMRGSAPAQEPALAQLEATLDGAAAAALIEAAAAEAAGISLRFPTAQIAEAFRGELARGVNLLGDQLSGLPAVDARGAVAAAAGLALAGVRGAALISGADLAGVQDQIVAAARRHLPLVVHASCRAPAGPGSSLGSGHEGYHAVADSGCLLLCATNVQEVADLALAARRTAEQALLPAVVAMDGEETAAAIQDVKLPTVELIREYLGEPDAQIACPTPAQQLLFGEQRRRLPRYYDLEHPALLGAQLGSEARGLNAAVQRPYFYAHLRELLEESLEGFGRLAGRHYGLVCEHSVADAEVVLVVQGSAVEPARAVADHLRASGRVRVGVIGVRCLRPFPGPQIADMLRGKRAAWVLERADAAASGEPPLVREVRVALQRAHDNARLGAEQNPGYPRVSAGEQPQVASALYGLAGHPLRAADLVALCGRAPRGRVYLGVDFAPQASRYPKRQAMIEQLRRAYPRVGQLGLRAAGERPDLCPAPAVTAAVHRLAGRGAQDAVPLAARVLRHAAGGRVRCRAASGWEAFDARQVDRLCFAPGETLRDPGDDVWVDLVVLATAVPLSGGPAAAAALLADLRDGGAVAIESSADDAALWGALPAALQAEIARRELQLYRIPEGAAAQRAQRLAGALLGILVASGRLDVKARKLDGAGEELLAEQAAGQAFAAAVETVQRVQIGTPATAEPAAAAAPRVPGLLRRLPAAEAARTAPDSVPAFFNQIGVLYQDRATDELFAEPALATGIVPPLAAAFSSHAGRGALLPAFDPAPCTGCGRCFAACPEGAIGAVALDGKALLEAGMELAKGAGADAEPLRMMVSKIAPKVGAAFAADPPPRTLGEALAGPPAELLERAPLPEERRAPILAAYKAVSEQLAALPVARTAPLFDAGGELLALAVNPDACKGCGLCVAACEPAALSAGAADSAAEGRARQLYALWEQLPDTSGETIARARGHADLGELGALLLSRHCSLAMVGGDRSEPGSGARIALRQVLAVAEYAQQRQLAAHLATVEKVRDEVAAKVRELLAEALPAGDIESLAEGLDSIDHSRASVGEITARVDEVVSGKQVDVDKLKTIVASGCELADLHFRASKNTHGLGRARLGLVFAPGAVARGIGVFPNNPFAMPAVLDESGEPVALARGVIEGQLREHTADQRALRRARMAVANPTEAALAEAALRRLSFAELSAEERRGCAPLLLVGASAAFADQMLCPLVESGLPVKIILLADGGLPTEGDVGDRDALGLLALGRGHAFVAQTAISRGAHLADALLRALAHEGPAIVQIYAPSPLEHGFAADRTLALAELAVTSRVFPLFTFDPAREGAFGTCLDIAANPEPAAPAVSDAEGELTPARWAAAQERFAALPVQAMVEQRAQAWRVLQELAGEVTPFVAKVREQAAQALAAEKEQALAALRAEYEQRLAALAQEQTAAMTQRVREGLLALAGYGGAGRGANPEKPA